MTTPFKFLISGGGVTGPTLAYWLARASTISKPIQITIIERSPSIVKLGQGIDVEGTAKDIASRMGVLQKIQSHRTIERGFRCIDRNNKTFASFEMGGMTNENEIMRGDLCEVLTNAAKDNPNVQVQYSRRITAIAHLDTKTRVTIARDGHQDYTEEFDAVIAADGLRSRTRDLIFEPSDTKDCIVPWPMCCAFFSIPAQPDEYYSRFQHALKGRSVIIRPVDETTSSVYLIAVGSYPDLTDSLRNRDDKARRQAWVDAFSDVNFGEFPRVLEEMQKTDNFYSDQILQVKLPHWHNGRCAAVGDAAYATAPITGQGVRTSMIGAYILAGELGTNPDDPVAAFEEYEKKFRPHLEACQKVPLWGYAPHIFNPQGSWGVWMLQKAFQFVAWTNITKWLSEGEEDKFDLPDYDFK